MVLWVIAFLIIVALIGAAIFLIIDLARLPGEIAAQRRHPYANAVRIAGVIGIVTGILWVLALIWAYVPYPDQATPGLHEESGAQRPQGASPVTEGGL